MNPNPMKKLREANAARRLADQPKGCPFCASTELFDGAPQWVAHVREKHPTEAKRLDAQALARLDESLPKGES